MRKNCRTAPINLFIRSVLFLAVLLIWSAVQAEEFRITRAEPRWSGDSLQVEPAFRGLFTPPVRRAVLAGIPLLLELRATLLDAARQEQAAARFQGTIVYDVWEEIFFIRGFGQTELRFEELEAVEKWFRHLPPLLITYQTTAEGDFRLRLDAMLTILPRESAGGLAEWLEQGRTTEEDLPSQERSTGFSLNLNRVVELFLSGSRKPEQFRATRLTEPFYRKTRKHQ